MSESAFYAEQVELFRQRYPAQDGWNVYIQSAGYIFAQLPDFIRAGAVEVAKEMSLIEEVRVEVKRCDDDNHVSGKLIPYGWHGEIALRWRDQPLHARYVFVAGGYLSDRSVVLVATKSQTALETLSQELVQFHHDREKADDSIKVINGPNMAKPKASWEDICLPEGMIEDIRLATETFFKSKERYSKLNLAYRRGFLFCGPPGCGKTSTARVIASTQPASCIVYVPKDASNEAEQLDRAFTMADDLAPSILILEDLDKFGHNIALSQLLNRLDGLNTPRGVLVIATTNEPDKLDPALILRPSRFDRVWSFPLPDFQQKLNFLAQKGQGLFRDETLHEIAKHSHGFSMAYLQEVFATATAYAVGAGREIDDDDLLLSLKTLAKQIKTSQKSQPKVGGTPQPLGFVNGENGDRD